MPRISIATSLWDPLVIELGDKVYSSVPRSAILIRDLNDLKEQFAAGKIRDLDYLCTTLGLTFGVPATEFQGMDQNVLFAIVEEATKYIGEGKVKKEPEKAEEKPDQALADLAAPETPEERKNG